MSHLSVDRIAALVDETPTSAELAHLSACALCARERASYASLASLAKAAPAISMPLTSWETLAPALRANGILTPLPRSGTVGRSRRQWVQAAAAVLLVAGGMLAGRATAGASLLPGGTGSGVDRFASVADARATVDRAEGVLLAARSYLANNDPAVRNMATTQALRATIAALEEAYHDSHAVPDNPVITSYRESTKALSEAAIRQLNVAYPTSSRMMVY